jgi:hypothetical protein
MGIYLAAPSGILNMANINVYNGRAGVNNHGLYINNAAIAGSRIDNCNFYNGQASGVHLNNVSGITFTNCQAYSNLNSGFVTVTGCYDITYNRCRSYLNGAAGVAASGNGFSAANADYNILIMNCLSYLNLNTGFAASGTTHGWIYNSLSWGNGDINHALRGGLWLNNTGVNPTTGLGWTMENTIINESYNVEVWLSAADKLLLDAGTLVLNYNDYWNTTHPADMASIDGGASKITWNTYNVIDGYEANSMYADPLLNIANNYFPADNTPCRNVGLTIAAVTMDFLGIARPQGPAYDIGPYELTAGAGTAKLLELLTTARRFNQAGRRSRQIRR